mgnify:CR=1 FL=1
MAENEFTISDDDFDYVEEVERNKSRKRGINEEGWRKTKLKEEKQNKRN